MPRVSIHLVELLGPVATTAFQTVSSGKARELSLARMALAWVLRHASMTSVLIGASRPSQVLDAVAATRAAPFEAEVLAEIDRLVAPLQP